MPSRACTTSSDAEVICMLVVGFRSQEASRLMPALPPPPSPPSPPSPPLPPAPLYWLGLTMSISSIMPNRVVFSFAFLEMLEQPLTCFQVKIDLPVAPGMVAPLDGTPDDQGVSTGTPEGGKKNKSGGPRRKVGRWSEEETNTLILLTNQVCCSCHSDHTSTFLVTH